MTANEKFFLPYVEFYITHSCNFNCRGCNRFNNYRFKGHELWEDYKNVYKEWSKKLIINRYAILGGEPFSNPDLIQWIVGLNELWPSVERVELLTNGSYIHKFNNELYKAILKTNTIISIGLHNKNRKQQVLDLVRSFLQHPISIERFSNYLELDDLWKQSYNIIKGDSWPVCDTIDQWNALPTWIKEECVDKHNFSPELLADEVMAWRFVDKNNVTIEIEHENFFHQGALIKNIETNSFSLHNSEVEKAHQNCHSKYCHHMMRGELSKCGQVVLLKDFEQQFNLDLSDADRELLNSYQTAKPNMQHSELKYFFDNIKNPIEQCKFCPENYDIKEITSGTKKEKFGKK